MTLLAVRKTNLLRAKTIPTFKYLLLKDTNFVVMVGSYKRENTPYLIPLIREILHCS